MLSESSKKAMTDIFIVDSTIFFTLKDNKFFNIKAYNVRRMTKTIVGAHVYNSEKW